MMGAGSSFPIDLILFGMIAAFLVLRLRSILGRRTGFERQAPPSQPPAGQNAAAPVIDGPGRAAGTGRRPHLAGTDQSDRADAGADALDRPQLRPDRLPRRRGKGIPHHRSRVCRRAIARHCAACCPRTPIAPSSRRSPRARPPVRPRSAPFTPFTARRSRTRSCADTVASITVRFVSDQISLTQDKDGHPVVGTDAVTEITDIWTFERNLSTPDPVWRLVSARSA